MSRSLSPILPEMPSIAIFPAEKYRRDEPPQSAVTNLNFDLDALAQIREAASTPSTLSELLHDPVILSNLTNTSAKKKPKIRRGSSSSHREPSSSSASVVGMVLAEEERQSHHLKAVLRSTGDRLEDEIRRADRAKQRTELAELRARDMASRVSSAESARHNAELDSARTKEEMKLLQMKLDSMQRELRRAQDNVISVERKRTEAEDTSAKSRDTARQLQAKLNEVQARSEAREESRRVEIQKYYDKGRQEGWNAGHDEGYQEGKGDGFERGKAAGFEEGKRVGRERGWNEGRTQGRKEERQQAIKAFDKFLAEEMRSRQDEDSDDQSDRVSRWSRSIYPENEREVR